MLIVLQALNKFFEHVLQVSSIWLLLPLLYLTPENIHDVEQSY